MTETPKQEHKDITMDGLIKQLDYWIEQCELQAEVFRKNNMTTAEISSQSYGSSLLEC